MVVTLVHIYIKKEMVENFLEETEKLHQLSLQEEGVLCYNLLQDELDKGKFVIYEGFATRDAEELHKNAEHTANWRKVVAPWLAYPRVHIKHDLVFPKA